MDQQLERVYRDPSVSQTQEHLFETASPHSRYSESQIPWPQGHFAMTQSLGSPKLHMQAPYGDPVLLGDMGRHLQEHGRSYATIGAGYGSGSAGMGLGPHAPVYGNFVAESIPTSNRLGEAKQLAVDMVTQPIRQSQQ
jgi:hypothetical protein